MISRFNEVFVLFLSTFSVFLFDNFALLIDINWVSNWLRLFKFDCIKVTEQVTNLNVIDSLAFYLDAMLNKTLSGTLVNLLFCKLSAIIKTILVVNFVFHWSVWLRFKHNELGALAFFDVSLDLGQEIFTGKIEHICIWSARVSNNITSRIVYFWLTDLFSV